MMPAGLPSGPLRPFTSAELRDMRGNGDTVRQIYGRARRRDSSLSMHKLREHLFGAGY